LTKKTEKEGRETKGGQAGRQVGRQAGRKQEAIKYRKKKWKNGKNNRKNKGRQAGRKEITYWQFYVQKDDSFRPVRYLGMGGRETQRGKEGEKK
jgi:hypothetical protein